MKKDNAVILCRISDQKQDDGYSLDAQERFGIEYCQKRGFNIIEKFRFVETGSKVGKRHKFDSMMDFLKDQIGKSKDKSPIHLVVEKPDRLTRNFTNREQLQFFVMTGKLEIHYYKDKRIVDRNCSPADIFTDDMMTSVSKYIALNIAREVKKGLLEKARNGWYPAHPPAGYKYTRDNGSVGKHGRKEARIIVDQEMKPIVYRIFELRAVEKMSYMSISDTIVKEFSLDRRKKYKFSKSSIEHILFNPFYTGYFYWQGEKYQGKHELFVPQSWVELAQGKMRGTPLSNTYVGTFSYLFKCAVPECGCQIIYDPKVKTNKATGAKKDYHYYHCTDSKGVHKRSGIPQINISEDKIWQQLESSVQNFSITEAMAVEVAQRIDEMSAQEIEEYKKEYFASKERLEMLVRRQDGLYDDYAKGLIDEEDFRRLKEKMKDEAHVVKSKLENDYLKVQEKVRVGLQFTLELAKDAELNWKMATPSERLVLLKNVHSNFLLDGLTVRYDLKKVFRVLAQIKLNGVSKKWCASHRSRRTGFDGKVSSI